MANLPLIIGGAVLVALLAAIAFITDIFRRKNSAAQEALTEALADVARLEQRERALRAQVTALEEQLAGRNTEFEKQSADADAQSAHHSETIAALEQQLAQEKQAAANYRQTFDAQLADNDRLHADLARTVSQMTGLWQALRATATGEVLENEATENAISVAPASPEAPTPEEAPVHDTEILDLEPEAMIAATPAAVEHTEMAPAIS